MSQDVIRQLEVDIAVGKFSRCFETDNQLVKIFTEGSFQNLFETRECQRILNEISNDDIRLQIANSAKNYIDSDPSNSHLRQLELLLVGVACLYLYIQNNWNGPPTNTDPLSYVTCKEHINSQSVQEMLSVDGEAVYSLSQHPVYLLFARTLLIDCSNCFLDLKTSKLWQLRCIAIHQQILEDKSPTLKAAAIELMNEVIENKELMHDNKSLEMMFHIEAGNMCHTYFEYKKALEHFASAKKLSGLSIELSGAMGKRTKFQQEDKAQLVLKVTRLDNTENTETMMETGECSVPKNLSLEDEDVLNDINFTDADEKFMPNLTSQELVLLLGVLEDHRRNRAQERLLEEEMEAYLTGILSHPKNWTVQKTALLIRSKIQRSRRRTVERSMMQLEEIVNETLRDEPPAADRLPLFFFVHCPPVWLIQKELADLFLSLGTIGAAIKVYERLQMWEDVIACYQRIGKKEIAQNLVEEQLKVKETPTLLCFYGDVTGDKAHYERAWELSNHKSARAMRCLAYIHLSNKEFSKSIDCFQKSLDVNSLQVSVWFTFGCAAMADEQYSLAAKAFKRCVTLEYDNFEAWNNLAAAYIKLKEKNKAYLTLKDALKCSFDNWKIWENYIMVCIDIGEFNEAMHAYHRLLDLKEKYLDAEILKIFTRIVIENINDAHGESAMTIRPKLLELLGRVTAKTTSNGDVWKCYAQVLESDETDKSNLTLDKISQYWQKCHRCYTQKSDWVKDESRCKEMADNALSLAAANQKYASTLDSVQSLEMLSSTKLMLRGILTKIKQQHTDPVSQALMGAVTEKCNILESELEQVINKIEQLKATQ